MNHPTHFRKITILRFVLATLVLLFSVPAFFADGIASRYPNDVGIENDPNVILFDGFESYTLPSQLRPKWNEAGRQANLRIATEPGNFFAGRKSLEMKLPMSVTETVNSVTKRLSPEEPILFIRAYTKFDVGFNVRSGHNGLRISGHYPGGAGVPAPRDGTGFFLFSIQNRTGRGGEVQPGYSAVYSYWPYQRTNFGDNWYPDGWVSPNGWGDWILYPNRYPHFSVLSNWQPQRGIWYCYEFMVKTNTVGSNNGEVAYWIDGNLVGYFPDLFIRSINSLKIDEVALRLTATSSTRVNKKWYDNVVIARSYIGPISH